jgi:hypothetical protein
MAYAPLVLCLAGLAFAGYETFVLFRSRRATDSELPFITPRYAFRIRIAAIALGAGFMLALANALFS